MPVRFCLLQHEHFFYSPHSRSPNAGSSGTGADFFVIGMQFAVFKRSDRRCADHIIYLIVYLSGIHICGAVKCHDGTGHYQQAHPGARAYRCQNRQNRYQSESR